MSKLQDFYFTWKRRIVTRIVKSKLNLSDVSLISMNCIGGIVYIDCKSQFLSPTAGLFMLPGDFIKFVNNLDEYLTKTPVVFMGSQYPIGILGDIKIYFMHYASPEEAVEKWERRKLRVNKDKIIVIMVERNGFRDNHFEAFKQIKYPKVLFTKSERYICEDSIYIPKFKDFDELPDIIPGRYMYYRGRLVKKIKNSFK